MRRKTMRYRRPVQQDTGGQRNVRRTNREGGAASGLECPFLLTDPIS